MTDADDRRREVLIVGTGPAGLTAAAYAGRAGLSTTMFEREGIGGELVNRDDLRGYPGFPGGVPGPELRAKLVEEVERYDPSVVLTEVTGVTPGSPHVVETGNGEYRGDAVVVATGGAPAKLGVPGEEEFLGMGVFTCAKCDGPLYQGERLAVAGGSTHAVVDALFLTEVAAHVTVYDPAPELPADEHVREEALAAPNLTVEPGTEIAAVDGAEGVLETVRLRDVESGDEWDEPVGGLFVHVGIEPNTGFLEGAVPLTEDGHVRVDGRLETDVDGIFAVGDVRQDSPHEVASAVGDGATAIEAAKGSIPARRAATSD